MWQIACQHLHYFSRYKTTVFLNNVLYIIVCESFKSHYILQVSNFIMQVVKCLPVLSQLLYHDNQGVVSDACWSLSFLADGSNKRIQLVIDAGVTMRLIELLL